jgi:hypothetical protein
MTVRSTMLLAVVAGLSVGSAAQASFFSFASDVNDRLPTWVGSAGSGGAFTVTDAGPNNRFTLLIDDNNGPAPAVPLNVRLEANLSANWVVSPTIAPGVVLHKYTIDGSFSFRDGTTGALLLTGQIENGVFDAVGTSTSWSSTANFAGSDAFGTVTYTATQALVDRMIAAGVDPATYGIRVGSSTGTDDASFALTRLIGNLGGNVAINATTRLPTTGWTAEGSFSGSASNGVPAPASMSLLALAGVVAGRRRRA